MLTCDESCMEWETFSVSTFLYLQSARIVEDLLVFGVEKRLINFCKIFPGKQPIVTDMVWIASVLGLILVQ